ncbi:MAG: hypothetical protein WC547_11540, partial [Candidatus Omnitrophota bacterium]
KRLYRFHEKLPAGFVWQQEMHLAFQEMAREYAPYFAGYFRQRGLDLGRKILFIDIIGGFIYDYVTTAEFLYMMLVEQGYMQRSQFHHIAGTGHAGGVFDDPRWSDVHERYESYERISLQTWAFWIDTHYLSGRDYSIQVDKEKLRVHYHDYRDPQKPVNTYQEWLSKREIYLYLLDEAGWRADGGKKQQQDLPITEWFAIARNAADAAEPGVEAALSGLTDAAKLKNNAALAYLGDLLRSPKAAVSVRCSAAQALVFINTSTAWSMLVRHTKRSLENIPQDPGKFAERKQIVLAVFDAFVKTGSYQQFADYLSYFYFFGPDDQIRTRAWEVLNIVAQEEFAGAGDEVDILIEMAKFTLDKAVLREVLNRLGRAHDPRARKVVRLYAGSLDSDLRKTARRLLFKKDGGSVDQLISEFIEQGRLPAAQEFVRTGPKPTQKEMIIKDLIVLSYIMEHGEASTAGIYHGLGWSEKETRNSLKRLLSAAIIQKKAGLQPTYLIAAHRAGEIGDIAGRKNILTSLGLIMDAPRISIAQVQELLHIKRIKQESRLKLFAVLYLMSAGTIRVKDIAMALGWTEDEARHILGRLISKHLVRYSQRGVYTIDPDVAMLVRKRINHDINTKPFFERLTRIEQGALLDAESEIFPHSLAYDMHYWAIQAKATEHGISESKAKMLAAISAGMSPAQIKLYLGISHTRQKELIVDLKEAGSIRQQKDSINLTALAKRTLIDIPRKEQIQQRYGWRLSELTRHGKPLFLPGQIDELLSIAGIGERLDEALEYLVGCRAGNRGRDDFQFTAPQIIRILKSSFSTAELRELISFLNQRLGIYEGKSITRAVYK